MSFSPSRVFSVAGLLVEVSGVRSRDCTLLKVLGDGFMCLGVLDRNIGELVVENWSKCAVGIELVE